MKKIYEQIRSTTYDEVLDSVQSKDAKRICFSMVEAAFSLNDGKWVQELCLSLILHEDSRIRQCAATCLSHLARIHGKLDLRRVLPALELMRNTDPEIYGRGCAEDALEEIHQVWKPIQDPI